MSDNQTLAYIVGGAALFLFAQRLMTRRGTSSKSVYKDPDAELGYNPPPYEALDNQAGLRQRSDYISQSSELWVPQDNLGATPFQGTSNRMDGMLGVPLTQLPDPLI